MASFVDLASFETRGADVDLLGSLSDNCPNTLDIWIPTPLCAPMGVADIHPKRRLFPTQFTNRRHVERI